MKMIVLPLMVGVGVCLYEPRQPQNMGLVMALIGTAHLAARFARDDKEAATAAESDPR